MLLRETHRRLITDDFGRAAGNGQRVLERLYRQPIVSVANVQALINTTYPAANNLVDKLVRHGVLHEITGQRRNRRFLYRDYSALFHEPDDTVINPT